MKYRKDIQILRGISVLLVVFFHFQLPTMESGFVGVDIFFVISGFLMAILYDSSKKGEFFVKRARRLLPAYFVTVLLVLVASFFLTIPNEFDFVVIQSIFATFFSSNIGFWLENSYFSKAFFNPLLHLWSLGVEIQFYVLVPLIHWLWAKSRFNVVALGIFSLAACLYVVGISPKTSFFMMPLRLWEFLIGFCVAKLFTDFGSITREYSDWLKMAPILVLAMIPLMQMDGQALGYINGHPGLHALFVCLATGAILAIGLPAIIEKSRLGDFLEIAGKYSYSIYLVHFPLIVLALYEPFSGTILSVSNLLQGFLIGVAILGLSLALYHGVEVPFRRAGGRRLWLWVSPCLVLMLSFIGPLLQARSFSDDERLVFEAWTDRDVVRCGKLIRILEPGTQSCEITSGKVDSERSILLVGDSHADSIKKVFASVADSMETDVYFLTGGEPLKVGGMKVPSVIEVALSRGSKNMVVHVAPRSVPVATIVELAELARANEIAVAYIMPVPVWHEHIPKRIWENLRFDRELPHQTLDDYQAANEDFHKELKEAVSDNFKVYPVAHIFCDQDCVFIDESGKSLYFDGGHLTLTGSSAMIGLFEEILQDLFVN